MTESKTLCVNDSRYFHHYSKKEITSSIDLLSWIDSQKEYPKCYWRDAKTGVEIATIGSLITLDEVPHFDVGNDSPARFWGGHAFFRFAEAKDTLWKTFPRCAFFLPKHEIIQGHGKCTIISNSLNSPLIEEIDLTHASFSPVKCSLKDAKHLPTQNTWIELIEDSLQKIEGKIFEKVVMARRSTHSFNESLSAFEMLSRMNAKGAIHFAFAFKKGQTYIGATPERLYQRSNENIHTEAIAGTRKRGSTPEEDLALENELMENPKERAEFAFVKTSIFEKLNPLCTKLIYEDQDHVLKTPNVQHLCNAFEGSLKDGVSDEEILRALHPTAAMGGFPKESSLEHLLDIEPFERGWYASPLGYLSQREAEFAVGIRSVLVDEQQIHLFAGAGIVASSIPHKEWEELEHKISLWKKVMV